MKNWKSYFPCLDWGTRYSGENFSSDLIAAIIVTIMLIPQSLAYALLAGLPPQVGLYASIAPLFAYAIFGTSRTLAVGPVAVVSLMTATAVGQVADVGTADYVAAAMVLALLSGLFLAMMGLLRLGFLANLLSHPVISGFITASGILIAASQLKHILGIKAHGHSLITLVHSLWEHIGDTNIPTLTIGASVVAALFFVRSSLKSLLKKAGLGARPADMITKAGPVIAVILSTLAVITFNLDEKGVPVVGDIPRGLPGLTLPAFDSGLWLALAPAAILISLIGFVESVSVGQTLAAKRRQRIDPDQELVGLGTSNIAAALTGGYPVTGGFARSVVNFDAGAETPLAGAMTAVGIGVTALFLTPLFKFLPIATLAATIIVAVLSLVDLGALRRAFAYSRSDFAAMLATILVTLAAGVEPGVMTGVGVSIALHLWRTSRPHVAIVGRVPGTEHFRNIKRHQVECSEHILSIRIDQSLYFANARFLEDTVYSLVANTPAIRHVILMCPAVNEIDGSALESLEAINRALIESDVTLSLSEVKGPVMDRLQRTHFLEELSGKVYLSQYEAVCDLDTSFPCSGTGDRINSKENLEVAAQ